MVPAQCSLWLLAVKGFKVTAAKEEGCKIFVGVGGRGGGGHVDTAAHHPQDPQTGPPGAVGRPEAAKATSRRRICSSFKIFFFKRERKCFQFCFVFNYFLLFFRLLSLKSGRDCGDPGRRDNSYN